MNFLQGKNGMERASFDAVWPHLPCLRETCELEINVLTSLVCSLR